MDSVIEVVTGTGIGLIGSWLIAYFTMQLVSQRALAATITVIGCTFWSLGRGYAIRRFFARRRAS